MNQLSKYLSNIFVFIDQSLNPLIIEALYLQQTLMDCSIPEQLWGNTLQHSYYATLAYATCSGAYFNF